jgi:HPt (histidine-containing phosphotransfer) domain-containing protein
MNNKKLYVKLLTKFKTDTNLDELTNLIQAHDYEKAQIAAHTIKGVAGNLSLTALYEHAIALEAQIKSNTVNSDAVEKLKTCFNETLKAIEGVLAS